MVPPCNVMGTPLPTRAALLALVLSIVNVAVGLIVTLLTNTSEAPPVRSRVPKFTVVEPVRTSSSVRTRVPGPNFEIEPVPIRMACTVMVLGVVL